MKLENGLIQRLKWLKEKVISKTAIGLILTFILLLGAGWYLYSHDPRPDLTTYVNLCKAITDPDYLTQLRAYVGNLDPIEPGSTYMDLLYWEARHIEYVGDTVPLPGDPVISKEGYYTGEKYPGARATMPIAILEQKTDAVNITHRTAIGRCGEFSQLYFGLCRAYGIPARLVLDCSGQLNQSKYGYGDHVWVEVLDTHMHVDPTQVCYLLAHGMEDRCINWINNKQVYANPLNKGGWNKDINEVWAIDENGREDVTKDYKIMEG